MKDYVLDSNAIILYLIGAADSAKTARLFRDVQDGSAHLAMSAVNWAECWHILIRQRSARQADAILNEIAAEVEIVPADREHAERAGHLRCRFSASLADCFAASLAMARRATLVTADPEFEALEQELKVLRLESGRAY